MPSIAHLIHAYGLLVVAATIGLEGVGFPVPGDRQAIPEGWARHEVYHVIANYNTRKSVSASLSIPKNTKFSGLTAEWIVERTSVNGSFNRPLPFYARAYMDNAYAYRNGSNRAINYASEANENITMMGSTSLSKVTVEDATSMWFQWLAYF